MIETRTMTIKIAVIMALLAMVESALLSFLPFGGAEYGVFYGTTFSLLAFLLIVSDAGLLMMEGRRFIWGFALRYVIFGICLASSAMYSTGFFFGSFVGLMNLKISAMIFGRWLCEN